MSASHPSDDGPVLDAHVRCDRCGYDLVGTPVLARCPECGIEVLATVSRHADPGVAHLASPESPGIASAAVVAATAVPLLVVLVQGSGPAMRAVDGLAGRGSSFPSQVERPSWLVAAALLAAAALLVARGLSGTRNPTLRASIGATRIRRLFGGLAAWSAVLACAFAASLSAGAAAASFPMVVLAAQVLPMAFTLFVLAPVLGRTGAMSRTYREARHGRQGAEVLSVTTVAAVTLWVAAPAIDAAHSPDLATVARGLAAVLLFLSFLGLAYLAANGWVIAASLRAPRIDPRKLR